jgi:murein L,D-transpeptidase YafK
MVSALVWIGVVRQRARPAQARDDAGVRAVRRGAPPKAPLPCPLLAARIVVLKSERRLVLCAGDKVVREYPIGLGFSPEGDKVQEGDGRTPEGEYYVCAKNPNSRFHLSLGLNYPNEEDAVRGLASGLITRAEYERIMAASQQRRQPPWDTVLGGEIFIHGHGASRDWTLGCIALHNEDVAELYEAVPVGTSVTIRP